MSTLDSTSASNWSHTALDVDLVGTANIDLRFAGLSPLFPGEVPGLY